MDLEACTQECCSAERVQHALGLKTTPCEGKGSCWLIAVLAAFENLLKSPRNLTLDDRAVDLSCRHEVLERFTRILADEPDDALGGLLQVNNTRVRRQTTLQLRLSNFGNLPASLATHQQKRKGSKLERLKDVIPGHSRLVDSFGKAFNACPDCF